MIRISAIVILLMQSVQLVTAAVVINEIHYDPDSNIEPHEFIELYNAGSQTVDLSGWQFDKGIAYTFPAGVQLTGGAYLVVAENPASLLNTHHISAYGPWAGRLSNEGETIRLIDGVTAVIDTVSYKPGFPWPSAAGGGGSSMELIDPLLDNDLGGSWRSSGPYFTVFSGLSREYRAIFPDRSAGWHYRKGTTEPSSPNDAWRALSFVEDGSWLTGQTPIGYGDGDDTTVLSDMINTYHSIYLRHVFTVTNVAGLMPDISLMVYIDDGCVVWLNGTEIGRFSVPAEELDYDDSAYVHEAAWETKILTAGRDLLVEGENILAIHVLNTTIGSSDLSIDATIRGEEQTEDNDGSGQGTGPTPGTANATRVANAPPQARQVAHSPEQPKAGEDIVVTVKVTDPDGVSQVKLTYQLVLPGNYIPAIRPWTYSELIAYQRQPDELYAGFTNAANWTVISMTDDGTGADAVAGDAVYTAVIPGQNNRTLVRYRIAVTDAHDLPATVTVPYADDEGLNFACYVYDGVPIYEPKQRTLHPAGLGHGYDTAVMTALPVYHLVTRNVDIVHCYAYTSYQIGYEYLTARKIENWEGAFVYDGKVYDHMRYRVRGANGRYYYSQKRSLTLSFNRCHEFEARDLYGRPYAEKWKRMLIGKMVGNQGKVNCGLTETMNSLLWNSAGVPTFDTHWFHFRVIDGATEAPVTTSGQYYGDFWGLGLAMENYDGHFIDTHAMPDGNLYKFSANESDPLEQLRYQGHNSVGNANDFYNFRNNFNSSKSESSLRSLADMEKCFGYFTVGEAIKNYDVGGLAWGRNVAVFFNPVQGSTYGQLWYIPFDSDLTWGPNWNYGVTEFQNAIGGKSRLQQEYRNFIREYRDLFWREEVFGPLLDALVNHLGEFAYADADRWLNAPADAGTIDSSMFQLPRTKADDMMVFAFVGGKSWPSGTPNGYVDPGGRAKHLDDMATAGGDDTNIPNRPTIQYTGPQDFPANMLVFESSGFSDPQGDSTFAAMQWRIGEYATNFILTTPLVFEYSAVWKSDELTTFSSTVTVPPGYVQHGHTYRARIRMKDTSGRWSHWSDPVTFTAGMPSEDAELLKYLRVTELMYNPPAGSDYEYIELQNISTGTIIDLSGMCFTNGIQFTFPAGFHLAPGAFLLVNRHPSNDLFAAHYALSQDTVRAGPYDGKFDNAGESVELLTPAGTTVIKFAYNDRHCWPHAADGAGHSLVPRSNSADQYSGKLDYSGNWRGSAFQGGSPGYADPDPGMTLRLNEIMAASVSNRWIELYNMSASAVNLQDWYLSDSPDTLTKMPLSSIGVLPGFSWYAIQVDLSVLSNQDCRLLLSYLPGTEDNRVADTVHYHTLNPGLSYSRFSDGTGFWAPAHPSPAAENNVPVPRPVISEIHYNPAYAETVTNPDELLEFIELYNPAPTNIMLSDTDGTWQVSGGIEYAFPNGTVLPADGYRVLVSFDPGDNERKTAFLAQYQAPDTILLSGPFIGRLANNGERIALEKVNNPGTETLSDEVDYFNQAPWPYTADGMGLSLNRIEMIEPGDDPQNWAGSQPSPGMVSIVPEPAGLFLVYCLLTIFSVRQSNGKGISL